VGTRRHTRGHGEEGFTRGHRAHLLRFRERARNAASFCAICRTAPPPAEGTRGAAASYSSAPATRSRHTPLQTIINMLCATPHRRHTKPARRQRGESPPMSAAVAVASFRRPAIGWEMAMENVCYTAAAPPPFLPCREIWCEMFLLRMLCATAAQAPDAVGRHRLPTPRRRCRRSPL